VTGASEHANSRVESRHSQERRVQISASGVQGSGFRVQGAGCRVKDMEFRVHALWLWMLRNLGFGV
jgi:hypothetical protein